MVLVAAASSYSGFNRDIVRGMIERFDASKSPEKKFYNHNQLGRFEVVERPALRGADVGLDDRAFLHTESGNRYMVRHSKSRGESLVIYNEREGGFKTEGAHTFFVRGQSPIAEIGKPINVLVETAGPNMEWRSTPVTRIEIRRGVERAVRDAVSSNEGAGGWGAALAGAIGERADNHARDRADTEIDPLEHFKRNTD
jgi:hypothetical protein